MRNGRFGTAQFRTETFGHEERKTWKFFDRQKEIAKLREIRDRSRDGACWTILTGRRRVGKTSLVTNAFGDGPYLYLFVTRSAEADLCDGFKSRIEAFTGRSIPGKVIFQDLKAYYERPCLRLRGLGERTR